MRTVLLLSGGIDSAVLLADFCAREIEVFALSVDYGQTHASELAAARALIAHYGVQHYPLTVDLSVVAASPLTGSGDLPVRTLEEIRKSKRPSPAYVPNRNAILLSLAAALAQSEGIESVAYGTTAEDAAGFADCRLEFVYAMERALALSANVTINAPFVSWTKSAVIKHGDRLSAPFHLTWSCYGVGEEQCGVCDACLVRRDAFEFANVEDPTRYAR